MNTGGSNGQVPYDLLVLHVVEDATDPGPETDQVRSAVRGLLEGSVDPGVGWGVRTAGRGDDPAGALVDLLVETGAEMLVLGSRRRSAVSKFLMGSTVQRVVLDAPVPVLVVKAPATG